jgi:hypothetical protein
MKKINNFKVGVIFSLLLFLSQNIFAQNFILNDDGLIDDRAKEKIEQIGAEINSKLGVNVYVYVKSTLGLNADIKTKEKIEFIKTYESSIIQKLNSQYVLLTIFVEDTHVNILASDDIKNIIDKNDILNGYVVPLLASKDKNTLFSKVSASTLNGYSAIADSLASSKKITLESNIGNDGKVSSSIWKVMMYMVVLLGLVLYTYAVLKSKKR